MIDNEKSKNLCLRLLHSETEDEVIRILKEYRYWNDKSVWKPYGDIPNNRGIVGNQQSSSVSALVEKLVNSIDAVLTLECYRKGIDPGSTTAPKTMQEAVEKFFQIHGGKLQNLDAETRTTLAEKILLVATGSLDNPCYIIIDEGEGQDPKDFPNTFLSLIRDNKTKIPFVQGKFGMGGTGVLQFTGTNSFQLIISKKCPEISGKDGPWGFTLIRRLEPEENQPQSMYVYLAPFNEVLSFSSHSIPVKPGKYPDPYQNELSFGTCIKLYNYKIIPKKLRTLATLDLRFNLQRYLQDPALPIRIQERRQGYRAHYYDTTMSGLCSVLADNQSDIEPGFDTGTDVDIPSVGKIKLRTVVLKEEKMTDKKYQPGVFFNVNGQMHGELRADFISRETKLDYINESMIIQADCTGLPARIREDLFLSSRDRMRQCDERYLLEDAIADYLKEHPGLRELNARRRNESIKKESQEETAQVIQELIRADPTLAELFGKGEKLIVPEGPLPREIEYRGNRFPTFFRIKNEPASGLVKTFPRNLSCRIEFETDATNDYFSRSQDPGHYESIGIPRLKEGMIHLWNGKAIARYVLPENCSVGDRFNVEFRVTDISRVIPFNSRFTLEAALDAPSKPPGGTARERGKHSLALPHIEEVYRDKWPQFSFDEFAAIKMRSGEEDNIDIFINMDNLFLKNEIARRKNLNSDTLKNWFKYGLALLAMGMLFQLRKDKEDAEDQTNGILANHFKTIEKACQGIAVVIVPVLAQLGKKHT